MLRVCLLLPILLLAGAPLSRAQEEDQEVTEKNSSVKLQILFICKVNEEIEPSLDQRSVYGWERKGISGAFKGITNLNNFDRKHNLVA